MTKDPVQTNKKEISERILRGSSWANDAENLVVSPRYNFEPGYRDDNFGFRPVRNVKEKV
jgi:formylglycine-generating enzyme required for sulfatase activity